MERITEKERAYVMEVLDGQYSSSANGQMTKRFEEKFAETFGVKYAISHANGTDTMHTALIAAGIKPGDEVIVPPLTMASTSFVVLHAGAVPVFADIDSATFNIDPEEIRKKITPRTRAIIPVALYGLSPDMDAIMNIAAENNLTVIEDDAQCFLGYYKDRLVGTIGHMASFSFQSSKHITSGEGGILITDNMGLADRARSFCNLGYAMVRGEPGKGRITKDTIQDPVYERHSSVGWNYRMSDLCAAVLLAQTERLAEFVKQRIKIAELYEQAARGCRWLVPQHVPEGYKHSYWTYVLKLGNDVEFSWYDFRKKYLELGGDGIYAAWQLNYLEPALSKDYPAGLCPIAESVQPRLLQFKTNYMDMAVAEQKAGVLEKTIAYFGK
ncbi:DegT/DnrJ/EryC1/StrS family aminotransferase [Chloroflexota bacterium]